MKMLRRMMHRLRAALSRRDDQDLAAELESHIQLQTEDNLRAGMAPETARREAILKFGGIESIKESYRDRRALPLLESLFSDLQYALRGWRRNPVFTLTAVTVLTLGIGGTTAIFSVVNTVLLQPMHIFDPDRLVMLMASDGIEIGGIKASPAKFAHFRNQSSVLDDVSALTNGVLNYTDGDVVESWDAERVSADVFRCLGIRVLQGRTFTPEEDAPNGPRTVVIGQGLWRQRFGGDPQILGRPVTLNGQPYTVIGIAEDSEGLRRDLGDVPQAYVSLQLNLHTPDEGHFFNVAARIKPGVSLEQARERLKASMDEYKAKSPNGIEERNFFTATPIHEVMVSNYRSLLAILLSAVGLVLLIACVNVANLLLARAGSRKREIAIRAAIGAGRRRMIRQLMTENLLLAVAAGALGSFLGVRGIRALLAVNTAGLPFVGNDGGNITMDWRVMIFVLAVSLGTAALFGILPAFQASRADLNSILKGSGRQSGGASSHRARAVLVVSEVTLAVILLTGSALLIRSFVWLYTTNRGFDTENVLTVQSPFSDPKFKKQSVVGETVHHGLDQIRSLPGVVAAGATSCMPIQCGLYLDFEVIGRPSPKSGEMVGGWTTVSPGFFETLRIPLKRGRALSVRDNSGGMPVVLINEAMVKEYWKDRDPLQDQIVIGNGIGKDFNEPPRQIVGIVADVREDPPDGPRPMMYVPMAQLEVDEYLW